MGWYQKIVGEQNVIRDRSYTRWNELNVGEIARRAGQGRVGGEELNPASARQRHIESVGRRETVGKPVYLRKEGRESDPLRGERDQSRRDEVEPCAVDQLSAEESEKCGVDLGIEVGRNDQPLVCEHCCCR